MFKKFIILLERGTAAGGVCYEGIEVAVHHSVDVGAGKAASHLFQARMNVQCTAAALPGRDSNFTAVLLKYANRGFVKTGKADVGDAAGEECHAMFAFSPGWEHLADLIEEKWLFGTR